MKLCDRCRVSGCCLNYLGDACKRARKRECPDVVYTNADRIWDMTDEELAHLLCGLRASNSAGHLCDGCVAEPFCHSGHNGMMDWLQQPTEEK